MLSSNYENFRRIASASQRGYWRHQAIAKLNTQISKGNKKLEYLKNILSQPFYQHSLRNTQSNLLPYVTIKHIDYGRKKEVIKKKKKENIPVTHFFVTELKEEPKNNISNKIFSSYEECQLYNQINLIPFEVKRVRPRTSNKVYLNIDKIEREFSDKLNIEAEKVFKRRVITGIERANRNFNDVLIQTDDQDESEDHHQYSQTNDYH